MEKLSTMEILRAARLETAFEDRVASLLNEGNPPDVAHGIALKGFITRIIRLEDRVKAASQLANEWRSRTTAWLEGSLSNIIDEGQDDLEPTVEAMRKCAAELDAALRTNSSMRSPQPREPEDG